MCQMKFEIRPNARHREVLVDALASLMHLYRKEYAQVFAMVKECTHLEYGNRAISFADLAKIDQLIKDEEGCDLPLGHSLCLDNTTDKDIRRALEMENILTHNKSDILVFTESQLSVLSHALNCYTRFGIKQYGIFLENIKPTNSKSGMLSLSQTWLLQDIIRNFENFTLPQNGSLGIYQDVVFEEYKIAYEMHQVFRYKISWAKSEYSPEERHKYFKEHMTVNYDEPMSITKEDMIYCEEIK